MANYCDYDMKIKGTKENCKKWLKKMSDCDEYNSFYGIFDAVVYDEGGTDESYYMYISGDCAWSLETCCRASGYSGGIDLFAENTLELSLIMEAWSTEIGWGFQEHYIYKHGQCIVDECRDYAEWYWDKDVYKTYKELKDEYPDAPVEGEFDEDGYVHIGGFEDSYCDYSI